MKREIEYTGKRPPKILMVDDKPANLLALRKVLKNINAELIEAENGNDALKLMLEYEFALALLDVQMPEMDGYELAEIMRTDERTNEIPIIFISAIFTDRLNIFKGFERGAFSFITKPFEPIELINKVNFFIEKYHAHKALEDSRLKYKDLYHNSPDMLFSVDLKSEKITECNQTLLKATGFKRNELIGKNVKTLYHKESIPKVENTLNQLKKTGYVKDIELCIITKDSQKIDVLLNAEGTHDNKGQLISSNSSLRDISELKKTRKQLEQTLVNLQRQTEELQNFVYLTSHDLQEPMLTVLSFVELLQEEYGEKLDETAAEYIRYCSIAAGRMRELITSLLDYLRIGHDETIEEIDLNELIMTITNEMKGSIKENNARLDIENLPTIHGNREDMKRLFHNLISNAIKFRKEEVEPIVHIRCKEDGLNWEFSIEDNGIGIEEKHYKKIFQIFQQLHQRGKYQGVGVGMSICKKIVEHYGGKIWLESKVGKGSKFYFNLPKDQMNES